jgi:hypothetical protein
MLELRPQCEWCGGHLPPDSPEALVCLFECTFCTSCNAAHLHGVCPS